MHNQFPVDLVTFTEAILNEKLHLLGSVIKQGRSLALLIFTEGIIWMKKGENALFDVTMEPHKGTEVCELVSIYLLGKL